MMHPGLLVLAAATPTQGGASQQGSFLVLLPAYAAIFALFYFLMIRPQRQRQREHGAMLNALKPGDKVVCANGIHATVVGVEDATVQVRIAEQVRIEVDKASITTIKRPNE
jgi:preprotein translocase subunit YajC